MANVITVIQDQCEFIPDFVEQSEGHRLFDQIFRKAQWRFQDIRIFNRIFTSPRLSAWYGNREAVYQYSGTTNIPMPWFDEIELIRKLIEDRESMQFNSVLLNLYRDGRDSMSSHSDDERKLGLEPVVASVSLGATRRFMLHPKSHNKQPSIKFNLSHGSLLIMKGKCQKNWKHSVPKTKQPIGSRINLTFRRVNMGLDDF